MPRLYIRILFIKSQLLRMLEPAVRPVAPPEGGAARSANVPIEQQSFDALLAEAQQADEPAATGEAAELASDAVAGTSPNLLGPLSQMGAIENASLRALVGRGGLDAPTLDE